MSRYWKYGLTSSRWLVAELGAELQPQVVQVVVPAPAAGAVGGIGAARVGVELAPRVSAPGSCSFTRAKK